MAFARPKKRFSQNFLTDRNLAQKIVALLEIEKSDTILEIGTGRGILTEIIATTEAKLITFEIDRTLMPDLITKFKKYDNVTVLNEDFLRANPSDHTIGAFKLIGNIPYDITSPLLDWITAHRDAISRAVITTQKELADRISSGPGSKNWAPISILTQLFFRIKKCLSIPPQAFYPRPKIRSSTLLLEPLTGYYNIRNYEHFAGIVHAAFSQRRKRLINNLAQLPGCDKSLIEKVVKSLGWDRNIRAEQITIEGFIRLAEAFVPANNC
ncbi:MAG: ribosomal RNA small subunit methyltransferase A [Candidatus Zixiibacteriota bacterium]|nr:MAG: ribosomal RNA small subunit methyltransferase A [candidate division Zixibacteria bacterium]